MVCRALSPHGRFGERIVMVGDSVSDITAAQQAGVTSVAVTWGWQSAARLRQSQPDHIINHPAELLTLLIQP